MCVQLLSEKDRERILSPYKKVLKWVEDTKLATAPYFDEVHEVLFNVQKEMREKLGKTT